MFRVTLFLFVAICAVVHGTPAPSPSLAPKDLSYLAMGNDDEMPELEDYHTKQFGELRTVLQTIKAQFREIIEDLILQVVSYFTEILKQMKVKLLKKLGFYRVSDVFRFVIEGMTDFIMDPVPDYYEPVKEPVVEPNYGYRPFSLASLLGGAKSNA